MAGRLPMLPSMTSAKRKKSKTSIRTKRKKKKFPYKHNSWNSSPFHVCTQIVLNANILSHDIFFFILSRCSTICRDGAAYSSFISLYFGTLISHILIAYRVGLLPLLRVTRSWSTTSGATLRIPVKASKTNIDRLPPSDGDPAAVLGEMMKWKTGRSSSWSVGERTAWKRKTGVPAGVEEATISCTSGTVVSKNVQHPVTICFMSSTKSEKKEDYFL